MNNRSSYEYPLNERIRSFLRLEFLFQQLYHTIQGSSEWDLRFALQSLFNILELSSRNETKSELIKELERHAASFRRHQQSPGIDQTALTATLSEIEQTLAQIREFNIATLENLRQQDFLNAVRQRINIAGGTCQFDLPALHFWLQQPLEQQQMQLAEWLQPLQILHQAIQLILQLLRATATPSREVASQGLLQKSLDSNTPAPQLLRIIVNPDLAIFPEISGSRHRFAIRFLEQPSLAQRPQQVKQDVEFRLACCII